MSDSTLAKTFASFRVKAGDVLPQPGWGEWGGGGGEEAVFVWLPFCTSSFGV